MYAFGLGLFVYSTLLHTNVIFFLSTVFVEIVYFQLFELFIQVVR